MQLKQKVQLLQTQIGHLQQERKDSRREFWQSCREFRMVVRRARVSLQGFADVDGNCNANGNANANANGNNNGNGNGNGNNNANNNDEEMMQATSLQQEATLTRTNAKQALDQVKHAKKLLDDGALDRENNLYQQRNQLERVRRDVQEMERELAQLEQGTKEFEQISEGYAKGEYCLCCVCCVCYVDVVCSGDVVFKR